LQNNTKRNKKRRQCFFPTQKSAYEIDWESEPLPKDIFTDKNKEDKTKERNTARDCMFDPNRQDGNEPDTNAERGTQVF